MSLILSFFFTCKDQEFEDISVEKLQYVEQISNKARQCEDASKQGKVEQLSRVENGSVSILIA